MTQQPLNSGDDAAIEKLGEARQKIMDQLAQVIVGQTDVIEELLISLFSRGHCLLEGVPGLAKTLMISTLARTLNLSFSRIQFTPDLMPADITGTEIIAENRSTGPAGGAVPDPGGQGAGLAPGAHARYLGRRPGAGQARAGPPAGAEFHRRER